jgi:acyl-CoA synthetase (AMP-forming)/AMP-acid ligase II
MFELPTIPEMIRSHARTNTASRLRFGRNQPALSYAQFWAAVEQRVRLLEASGFRPGQRVALTLSSTLDSAALIVALLHAGGTIVPLYYREGMRPGSKQCARISAVLRSTRAALLFTHAAELATLQACAAEVGGDTRVLAFEQVLATDEAMPLTAAAPRDCAWPSIIQFSAGSTAEPKGICLDQMQLAINLRGVIERIAFEPEDREVSWLPLYHDMGLLGGLLAPLYVGASHTLYPPGEFIGDPLSWLAEISTDRATITLAPQFAFNLCLLKHRLAPGNATYDLSSLRLAMNGAEVVDPERCEEFETHFARFGLRRHVILPSYGLAENCVAVSVRPAGVPWLVRSFERSSLAAGSHAALATSEHRPVVRVGNGHAVRGTKIIVLDESGSALPDGCVGELAVSGACAARTILNADGTLQPTQAPLRTGDLGLMFDGELFVVGRIKEMVKRNGEALAPTDIEQCVSGHLPGYPVAAFGYLDEDKGVEQLVVLVESFACGDAAHCEEISASVRMAILREFRLPLGDVIVAKHGSIPRTTSGKVRRTALRDQYVDNRPARGARADDQLARGARADEPFAAG